MKIHELKISPEYFEDVRWNNKRFELRKDDRDFEVGDMIRLFEYKDGKYTGRKTGVYEIRYILRNCPEYGLAEGYCILGL